MITSDVPFCAKFLLSVAKGGLACCTYPRPSPSPATLADRCATSGEAATEQSPPPHQPEQNPAKRTLQPFSSTLMDEPEAMSERSLNSTVSRDADMESSMVTASGPPSLDGDG